MSWFGRSNSSRSGSKKQLSNDGTISPYLDEVIPSTITEKQRALIISLCSTKLRQSHLFNDWSPNSDEALKQDMIEQLEFIDESYSDGLAGYIVKARDMLKNNKKDVNLTDGWKASVPVGPAYGLGTKEYEQMEKLGKYELGKVGFVLVAGGVGDRLGSSIIKLGLPVELATETCYLEHYIRYILAAQVKYAQKGFKLPLCIMTSSDTYDGTIKLLEDNEYFGMEKDQITIVEQGDGVTALMDDDASIAMESPYKVMTKPHGHGDIHALMSNNNIAKDWVKNGIKWITFFQDNNGLAFFTLPLALGVSNKSDLIMNSLVVPRKAGQTVGVIAKLTQEERLLSTAPNKEVEESPLKTVTNERTLNVAYNQLDTLLQDSGFPDGDDETTGFCPFPGNINQLIFRADKYVEVLDKIRHYTNCGMPEFVNPKYSDHAMMKLKFPTRVECAMQDFDRFLYKFLEEPDTKRIGFTSVDGGLCFSPLKNATSDGAVLQKNGIPPATAGSAESDQYAIHRKILRSVGVRIEDDSVETFGGVSFVGGPHVVISPELVLCPGDYKTMFPYPKQVQIAEGSSLVIKGKGQLVIESLRLEGALVIDCEEGSKSTICDVFIKNNGWKRVAVEDDCEDEVMTMRGYKLEKFETCDVVRKERDDCVIL